jgi:hypothetical protein
LSTLFRFQTLLVCFFLVPDSPGLFRFQILLVFYGSRLSWSDNFDYLDLDTPRSDPNIAYLWGFEPRSPVWESNALPVTPL